MGLTKFRKNKLKNLKDNKLFKKTPNLDVINNDYRVKQGVQWYDVILNPRLYRKGETQ